MRRCRQAVGRQVAGWTGPAGDAYRAHAGEHQGGMEALGGAAETMATIVEASGMLVALVRTLVRDAIAEFVSILAVRLWEWLAEEAGTFGLGTPLVIAQVSALVAKWANKIAHFMRALLASLRRLKGILTGDGKFSRWWNNRPGGGHLWPGLKGKTPFPKHWTVEDIKRHASDIATDPNSAVFGAPNSGSMYTHAGDPVRVRVFGTRDF